MKILICYNSHNESNSIASATMAEYKKENPKNFKLESFNLDKRNLLKYLSNEKIKNKPEVIYIFTEGYDFKLLGEKFNVKFIPYKKNIIYKTIRQPGNTWKTKKYYLYEKILYDMEANFEKTEMYRVSITSNEINVVQLHGFEANSPYAKHNMNEAQNCYHSKNEAKEHLAQRMYRIIDLKQKECNELKKKVNIIENEMKILQEECSRVLNM